MTKQFAFYQEYKTKNWHSFSDGVNFSTPAFAFENAFAALHSDGSFGNLTIQIDDSSYFSFRAGGDTRFTLPFSFHGADDDGNKMSSNQPTLELYDTWTCKCNGGTKTLDFVIHEIEIDIDDERNIPALSLSSQPSTSTVLWVKRFAVDFRRICVDAGAFETCHVWLRYNSTVENVPDYNSNGVPDLVGDNRECRHVVASNSAGYYDCDPRVGDTLFRLGTDSHNVSAVSDLWMYASFDDAPKVVTFDFNGTVGIEFGVAGGVEVGLYNVEQYDRWEPNVDQIISIQIDFQICCPAGSVNVVEFETDQVSGEVLHAALDFDLSCRWNSSMTTTWNGSLRYQSMINSMNNNQNQNEPSNSPLPLIFVTFLVLVASSIAVRRIRSRAYAAAGDQTYQYQHLQFELAPRLDGKDASPIS
jgi:hypothetical protein